MLGITPCLAQQEGETSRIYIAVVQPERENIPLEASGQLENKLKTLIMQNGIGDIDSANRFVLTTKASIINKDIVPGPPQKVSLNVDFTFIIGDAVENKIFESYTTSAIGVGMNENKAFIAAIKSVKPKQGDMVQFLSHAKDKIIAYYVQKCEDIKQEARLAANEREYDKAIYLLMQIPDICDYADECQELAIQYNMDRINLEAATILNNAKMAWSESPNANGASAVADIMKDFPANSASQKEADAFIASITKKLKADEARAWAFKLEQYRDKVEKQKRDDLAKLEQQRANNQYRSRQQAADNEYRTRQQAADNEHRSRQQAANNEYRRRQQIADNDARTQRIEACRQVGLAWARNQPKSITYNYQKNVILW